MTLSLMPKTETVQSAKFLMTETIQSANEATFVAMDMWQISDRFVWHLCNKINNTAMWIQAI
jgi:hypothetical protein